MSLLRRRLPNHLCKFMALSVSGWGMESFLARLTDDKISLSQKVQILWRNPKDLLFFA